MTNQNMLNRQAAEKALKRRRRCPAAMTSVAEGEELGSNLLRVDQGGEK
jgi:hypothetical protein